MPVDSGDNDGQRDAALAPGAAAPLTNSGGQDMRG